jgi:hypothetical protein
MQVRFVLGGEETTHVNGSSESHLFDASVADLYHRYANCHPSSDPRPSLPMGPHPYYRVCEGTGYRPHCEALPLDFVNRASEAEQVCARSPP